MKLISHRGNINGKNSQKENSPGYILDALKKGYDVEVDVWYSTIEIHKTNEPVYVWYLGHDEPKYEFDITQFEKFYNKLWFHCKNLNALIQMKKIVGVTYFWHQEDWFTLTSNNYIWTFPGKKLTEESICVLPEQLNYTSDLLNKCYGICSDFIERYK